MLVEIIPADKIAVDDGYYCPRGVLRIQKSAFHGIFEYSPDEIDTFPIISEEEALAAFTSNQEILSGGVTSDCRRIGNVVYKRYRDHHSQKYEYILPSQRALAEWVVLSRLQRSNVMSAPELKGVYASFTNGLFVIKMEYMDGPLLCEEMMTGCFNGDTFGRAAGLFLRQFHSIDFSYPAIRPVWNLPKLLTEKMDGDQFEYMSNKTFSEAWQSGDPTHVLCWGDACLKNMKTGPKGIRFFDFDQCVWAPPEFDIGYCLAHVDLYRICGYCSLSDAQEFESALRSEYGKPLNEKLLRFLWGQTLYYRRDGYAVSGIKERGRKSEIISRAIDVVSSY